MKYRLTILIVALLCGFSIYQVWAKGEEDAPVIESNADIDSSAIHSDSFSYIERSPEVTDETTAHSVRDDLGTDAVYEFRVTRQLIINTAYEMYGVPEEWTIWLIGTTWNEDYHNDRYLEYCWACEIINVYRNYSVWSLDGIWGAYYSYGHAYSGYLSADDTTLEMVWLALTDRDERIVEVDGMIDYPPSSYYLIYDSEVYNCQVWGE